jgi:hypothetical protein
MIRSHSTPPMEKLGLPESDSPRANRHARCSPTTYGPRKPGHNLELEPQPTLNPDRAPVPRIERLASRSVVDVDGSSWIVQEVRHWGYDRRASSSLVFTGDDAMRRVRNYPPNWIELSDAELIAISFGV